MFVKYKKDFEKIAMGLISLMPNCKDSKHLMEIIEQYEQFSNWQLYLWKQQDEFVGVMGVAVENEKTVIQHFSLLPSYRSEEVTINMLEALNALGCYRYLYYNAETAPYLHTHLSAQDDQRSCSE